MKKVLVILMTLVMVFAMTACGDGAEAPSDSGATITVEFEIDYPDGSGVADVEDITLEIPEGSSVLDALYAYGEAYDCEVLLDDTSSMTYVCSIGGVSEESNAGWTYEVNDEQSMETADDHILEAGDEVYWAFQVWA